MEAPIDRDVLEAELEELMRCVALQPPPVLLGPAGAQWLAGSHRFNETLMRENEQRFWCHDRPRSERNGRFGDMLEAFSMRKPRAYFGDPVFVHYCSSHQKE